MERGSALALVPAGVLVLLILAAICVDFSSAELARRQLHDAAAGAANDAAGGGLDQARLRTGDGKLAVDPDLARSIAERSIEATVRGPLRLTAAPDVEVVGNRVVVILEGDSPYIFSPAVGGHRRVRIRAEASATLRDPAATAAP
jgi:Flp pilus assembly protein TadG